MFSKDIPMFQLNKNVDIWIRVLTLSEVMRIHLGARLTDFKQCCLERRTRSQDHKNQVNSKMSWNKY